MSLAGYRRLIRRINITFAGDHKAIVNAKIQLKAAFMENRNSTALETHKQEIEEIDEFLRFHIVQAAKSVRGNFGRSLFYGLHSCELSLTFTYYPNRFEAFR